MRRFIVSLSLAVVVLLSLVASGINTQAQDATPAAMETMTTMATHPVVGVWDSTGSIADNTFPFLAIFHGDGTYQEVYPWGAINTGVWKPTGERTAEVTAIVYEYIEDRLARGETRFSAEVDETGNSIDTDGSFVSRFEDGSVDMAVEGPSPGTRLTVLPVVPFSELVPGGTPVIPAELTAEATPAP